MVDGELSNQAVMRGSDYPRSGKKNNQTKWRVAAMTSGKGEDGFIDARASAAPAAAGRWLHNQHRFSPMTTGGLLSGTPASR